MESAFPSWPGPITSFAEACLRSIPGNGPLHININKKDLSASLNTRVERERNVLFNDALNTFYLRLYGVRHMVKDHSDSEKGNPLPPHRLLLSINSKGFLYAPSHRQDNTYHGLCYTSRGALAGTRKY